MSQPIYYMRDNHTFKKLSDDVNTALIEIEHEFNEGYTYGMLCSKQEGFPTVHASGSKKRLEFFAECKTVLEQWVPVPPKPDGLVVGEYALTTYPGGDYWLQHKDGEGMQVRKERMETLIKELWKEF